MKRYNVQLKDHLTGSVLLGSGGVCFVAAQGGSSKVALLNADGSTLANPVSLTQGNILFHVADSVTSVDLYGTAPGGQAFRLLDTKPSGPNEIAIDANAKMHTMVIPFDVADQVGDATETPSGFTVPLNAMMLPHPALNVVTVDAAITIDVGTEGTSNDPNGFLAAVSTATAGLIKGTMLGVGSTMGALLSVDESAGDLVPEGNVTAGPDEDSISWTLLTAADTAAGFIILPYMLP